MYKTIICLFPFHLRNVEVVFEGSGLVCIAKISGTAEMKTKNHGFWEGTRL
jgi:hypothetical protein